MFLVKREEKQRVGSGKGARGGADEAHPVHGEQVAAWLYQHPGPHQRAAEGLGGPGHRDQREKGAL